MPTWGSGKRTGRPSLKQGPLQASGDPVQASTTYRWHKEIFADLAAFLTGRSCGGLGAWRCSSPIRCALTYRRSARQRPPDRLLARAFILAEMLRRMGFGRQASQMERVWRRLYDVRRFHRLPQRLLGSAGTLLPHVVDEIAFQTRRNLAHRALADIIRFRPEDEDAIQDGTRRLIEGGHSPPTRHAAALRGQRRQLRACLPDGSGLYVVWARCGSLGERASARPAHDQRRPGGARRLTRAITETR